MRDTIKRCAGEIKKRWPGLSVQVQNEYTADYEGLCPHSKWGTRLRVWNGRHMLLLLDHHNIGKARVRDVRNWIEVRTKVYGREDDKA